jgi:hypothetical protein
MEETDSVLFVQFEGMNSVNIVKFIPQNVSPMQILALAEYLEYKGKSLLHINELRWAEEQAEREQSRPKIEVPSGVLRK